MPEKIKDLLRSKWIRLLLIIPFLALATFITWPLPALIFGDPILKAFVFIKLYWRTLIVFVLFACAVVLFIIYLWPLVKCLLRKMYTYISLRRACRDYKYKYKTVRFPFASFKGLHKREDVKIITPKETYALHFVDVIYPSRSVITVSSSEYSVTKKALKKKAKKVKEPKNFVIPDFSADTDVKHVFLVSSSKCEARIIRGTGNEILANGDKFNSMMFFHADGFVRFLKR